MAKSVLIVDVNESIRKATRDFIESNTMFGVCGEASDGLDAVDKTFKLKPDLIILDIAMPGLDGLQAARAIRRRSAVPIILFTFYADAIRARDISSAGINVVVSKVADLCFLADQVNRLLNAPSGIALAATT
jgi:two-component system response regulator AlgR